MSSSAAQEVKNLTSTEGGSITLPDPVLTLGFLLYGKSNIAVVINSEIKLTEESFRNRVFWDKNTGLFTIIGLQRNDSGSYTVDSKTKGVLTSYRLTVYESVPQPGVNRSSVSAESCTLLCFVKKSEATTLSWYRGEEILNQSSTAASLPLTVHKHHFSSSYRCEAANPAEKKSLPVNFTAFCSEDISDRSTSESSRPTSWLFIIPMVVFLSVAVLLVIWMCFKKEGEKE
ncbi:CD48 antigen-like isoform X2 [Myripristis murdjan]|uniref:CD48 antigen-like isoform X2 n=1 Tax=Myripristis murdjan TaxID=586833 RepID=UPI00117647B9|nr:CD48 antigen-like isoform X2 [Myripristis murdjan]